MFKLVILLTLSIQSLYTFLHLKQVKGDPIRSLFIDFSQVTVILLGFGKTCCKKLSKKFKNHASVLAQVIFK